MCRGLRLSLRQLQARQLQTLRSKRVRLLHQLLLLLLLPLLLPLLLLLPLPRLHPGRSWQGWLCCHLLR
jgi:hypothetical protein